MNPKKEGVSLDKFRPSKKQRLSKHQPTHSDSRVFLKASQPGFNEHEDDPMDGGSSNIPLQWVGETKAGTSAAAALRPEADERPRYMMGRGKRGLAVIFNHTYYTSFDDVRHGTDYDCRSLVLLLEGLGFYVQLHHDYELNDIKGEIGRVAEYNHTECDCLIVVVLTHGNELGLHAKNTQYNPNTLCEPFRADNCPTLAGKPKIFIIQACQGNKKMASHGGGAQTDAVRMTSATLPSHADFLFFNSTIPGYVSWRDPSSGSVFIQSLCEKLKKNVFRYDLLSILTMVNEKVTHYESDDKTKQMPCITSTLTKLVKFEGNWLTLESHFDSLDIQQHNVQETASRDSDRHVQDGASFSRGTEPEPKKKKRKRTNVDDPELSRRRSTFLDGVRKSHVRSLRGVEFGRNQEFSIDVFKATAFRLENLQICDFKPSPKLLSNLRSMLFLKHLFLWQGKSPYPEERPACNSSFLEMDVEIFSYIMKLDTWLQWKSECFEMNELRLWLRKRPGRGPFPWIHGGFIKLVSEDKKKAEASRLPKALRRFVLRTKDLHQPEECKLTLKEAAGVLHKDAQVVCEVWGLDSKGVFQCLEEHKPVAQPATSDLSGKL